ncbi:MauE/DoxX family redox-associated membrane protein [Seonamhaeicola maritimus]|uniref:Methylamine utilisation protein MauE domain-containing protein n=1 Tax=Seonamhaeicola maritimus TaxID=2591822 RepID=A0A5C7GMQ3_9FLAO|nr:MauE/DoxX family redox-associated membrane protein [Seonamhaeicola maritimus]TXG39575.1 hypothetical protein FUA22_06830 [Seonamhaeicola maritimus]
MDGSNKGYQILTNTIGIILIMLFVYTASNKFLDFEHFKAQLTGFPFIASYANWIAWAVPLTELIIAVLFLFPKHKLTAFYMSLLLLLVFTTYIIVILNISDSIPCSCGGILSTLGWKEHIIFNCVFIALSLTGILSIKVHKTKTLRSDRDKAENL